MNIGRYLRGEDSHVGTSRIVYNDFEKLTEENKRLHKQNSKLLKEKQSLEKEVKVLFKQYQELLSTVRERLCVDEGCPHHGTPHECNPK